MKSLKDGRFTDDAFEFIEIRTAQIHEAIKTLMNTEITQPVVETVEPTVDLSGLSSNINKLLKQLNS
jgi:hypothetical protein